MSVLVVTGSAGLVGSEAVRFFCELGWDVVGIDNDMRSVFFGAEASTAWNRDRLIKRYPARYRHLSADIRSEQAIESVFRAHGSNIELIVHAAAQPSHDWSIRDPSTDFTINANGTLVLLEAMRRFCPEATFIFTSTNKVYGDTPNTLPLVQLETRWELAEGHPFYGGIDETMSIDASKHSLFGASKLAADILVQEYGRYFDMRTTIFRCGCLTGPDHSGTPLHGFLAYLMKCVGLGLPYTVYGYEGKQVRDNIHSADLISAFFEVYHAPRSGEVYNMGGGRHSNCSMLEAIALCERIAGRKLSWEYTDTNRIGDHVWYISNLDKFQNHYPAWQLKYDLEELLVDIYQQNIERWAVETGV